MEPVTVEEAKAQLRVLDAWEDGLIAGKIVAARQFVETITGHILVRRQGSDTFSAFRPHFELTRRPVVSIDRLTYTDTTGATVDFTDVGSSVSRLPVRVFPLPGSSWPTLGQHGEVTITYTAGYAEGDVPAAFVEAILIIVAGSFDDRAGGYEQSLETAGSLLQHHSRSL